MVRSVPWMVVSTLLLVVLSGCVSPEDVGDATQEKTAQVLPEPPTLDLDGTMGFAAHVVDSALHYGVGLYEPTIDVSGSGIIYISAHTAGVATTGAPAFYSADDGATWQQLPFAMDVTAPEPVHGGTPPPSDEIFIVAGDDGQAWGVDILLGAYPVNGWCGDGTEQCYHNPNAFDRTAEDPTCEAKGIAVVSLNDRPWAAYANDTLLMVNNPGGGPVQVASMQVPPPAYVGASTPLTGPTWNLCGSSGGGIPGIPDLRDDGYFAVPQVQGEALVVVTGYASDVMDLQERHVFDNDNEPASEVGEYGQAVFDADGTLFVGAMSNSETKGGIRIAVSQDDGATFTQHRYAFDQKVSSIYLDGNKQGTGGIINWGLVDGDNGTDWYIGHLDIHPDGTPVIRHASLAVDNGPEASRHVQGAALGPDGRAYMVMSEVSGNDREQSLEQAGTNPLSVVVQNEGPKVAVLGDMLDADGANATKAQ